MAKVSAVQKNLRRQALVKKYADARESLRSQIRDKSTSAQKRVELCIELANLPRDGNPIRVRNRCVLTGRPRGVYRKFALSRICLRELANSGMLPGVFKASDR